MTILPNNLRTPRGLKLLAAGAVRQLSRREFEVQSESGNGSYRVVHDGDSWICTCPDHQVNHEFCKHTWAVELGFKVRSYAHTPRPPWPSPPPPSLLACPKCGNDRPTRKGIRVCARGRVQRYGCSACGHRFVADDGFSRLRATPKAIVTAFDLWAKKVSYRQIAHHLEDVHGLPVAKSTIERWVRKLAKALAVYCDDLRPQVGMVWHADETTINVDGELLWTWNVMDHKTRFWLASTVTTGRTVDEARKPLKRAKQVAGQRPQVLITDGLPSYSDAAVKEYYQRDNPTSHLVIPPIRRLAKEDGGAVHPGNNIIERLQGTQRERTKVLRAFDGEASAKDLVDGLRAYYNLVRPHQGLAGLTPSEAAGAVPPSPGGEGRLRACLVAALRAHPAGPVRPPPGPRRGRKRPVEGPGTPRGIATASETRASCGPDGYGLFGDRPPP